MKSYFSNVNKYIDENIKDNNIKVELFDIYNNYGYEGMLSAMSQAFGDNDFTNEHYYRALLRDYEEHVEDVDVLDVVDTVPLGRFTSFVYWLETDYLGYNELYIIGASHTIRFKRDYMSYDGVSSSNDTFIKSFTSVQVNLGWSNTNDFIIEWFYNGEFQKFMNLTQLLGSGVSEFADTCQYRFSVIGGEFIKFDIPNKNLVSNEFINNFN